MANKKYDSKEEAIKARRLSNLKAQRKFRERKLLKRATEASQSDSTMDVEIAAEAPGAADPPVTTAQDASRGARSTQNGRRGPDHPSAALPPSGQMARSTQNERRGTDPPSATLSPSEHVARIEQAIDDLLKNISDFHVQKSLQDSIVRIEPKFRDLVGHVRKNSTLPMQRVEHDVPRPQYQSHRVTTASARGHNTTSDTIRALTGLVCQTPSTQCSPLMEIQLMRRWIERGYRQYGYSNASESAC
ncbi:hypothetical protein Alg130_10184 [Pyrenophora tritici-repentis]|nr:hypothetical protein Alg130_10184 [Pyrenophora tritici-repentis]